jgi:UDP-glucuronate 4-epimerase
MTGESLCDTYQDIGDTVITALRFFTVYGPRQRPDMAIHRLLDAARREQPFTLYGDGLQIRDFAFVADVVRARTLAAKSERSMAPVNVAGGDAISMRDLVEQVGRIVGKLVRVDFAAAQAGDVARAGGDSKRAASVLRWSLTTSLEAGLRAQLASMIFDE